MHERMKLVIDGNVWGRGHSSGGEISSGAQLVITHPSGKTRYCCVALLGLACGQSEAELSYSPEGFKGHYPINAFGSADWSDFYRTNDHPSLSDAERAHTLRVLFSEIGVDLEFVNVPGVSSPEVSA